MKSRRTFQFLAVCFAIEAVAVVNAFVSPQNAPTHNNIALPKAAASRTFSSVLPNPTHLLRHTPFHEFRHSSLATPSVSSTATAIYSVPFVSETLTLLPAMDRVQAEAVAGPFFGASLFPYLAFLYFLNVEENDTPKGVTVGFATCLLFVFLTIPASIIAQAKYGVSLADCDWLHGSAESLLTVTNLVTVLAFRQALVAKEKKMDVMPRSTTSYAPMVWLVALLTAMAIGTALLPALSDPQMHTPYLGGFMDLPKNLVHWGNTEPENALTVACWIIHVSSLVEFLVAMGFAWRWADVSGNPKWKGLTWGLLPLHTSGITACTYHLFYNQISIMVPFQALLTCIGNTSAAYAAYRIAISNGWKPPRKFLSFLTTNDADSNASTSSSNEGLEEETFEETRQKGYTTKRKSLIGFEDLGDALADDKDYSFVLKLFAGCALTSYAVKYGELFFDFPFDANVYLAFSVVLVPTALNAFKWYRRSLDSSFEGWF